MSAHNLTLNSSKTQSPTVDCGNAAKLVGRRLLSSGDAPPTSNTGVLVSSNQDTTPVPLESFGFSSQAKIDWLAFTLHDNNGHLMVLVDRWTNYFHGSTVLPHGSMGYTCAHLVLGTGRIMFNPSRPDMGVHISLPASALAAFAALYPGQEDEALWTLLARVKSDNGKFTRVDIAADTMALPMSTIEHEILSGSLVSRMSTVLQMRDLLAMRRNRPQSNTIYIGAATSDRRVRFYDKAVEQGILGVQWTRVELQCRGGAAEAAAKIAFRQGNSLEAMIADVVDFRVDNGEQTNRRRRCDWWENWLGSFRCGLSWGLSKSLVTLEKSFDWVVQQVAPTLAFLRLALGDSVWMLEAALSAENRISPYRRSILRLYAAG